MKCINLMKKFNQQDGNKDLFFSFKKNYLSRSQKAKPSRTSLLVSIAQRKQPPELCPVILSR